MTYPELLKIVLSVDNDEWYYGREENRTKPEKRMLVESAIPESRFVSPVQAKEINRLFAWTVLHEKETAKKKKRLFYIDRGFLIGG